ncbi:polyprenyl synthetase family protein [Bacillus sp. FJAT-44742]|uniref:polyprenyl synthetase family protein n=1 Tax=Bacillus sp. FJAT-44742 TaxID=2014005 RepID=UPI001E4FBAB4|nr:farnesyl diphosphate synthase [Bacillus sp. FJAT-44742]
MTEESLQAFIQKYKDIIDKRLPELIDSLETPPNLKDSMIYSLNAGGKRIRPLLMLAVLKAYDSLFDDAYDIACAAEMVHTYSLIHDDLPAMDDDDVRRGKPTNHKVFGEAIAILAGDALFTRSIEIMASETNSLSPEVKVRLLSEFVKASGPEGMVGGQAADLNGEGKSLSLEELEYIHHHKTGDLLTYSIVAGAIMANAPEQDIAKLRSFAKALGLVFQIKDDILDVEGDASLIGKPVGSDDDKDKSTYPSLLTLEGAKKKLAYHAQEAKETLSKVSGNMALLNELTDYIVERDH